MPPSQLLALYDMFLGTGMVNHSDDELRWFDPLNVTSYCMFPGIQCDDDGYILIVDLGGRRLGGTIPDSVGGLERLMRLKLDDNQLQGPIPMSLTNLSNLLSIDLGRNLLSGVIPDFSSLPSLKRLILNHNALIGTIPFSLCNVTNLVSLDLEANTRLEGTIPSCLSDLEYLRWLRVSEIGLVGNVPDGLCSPHRDMNGLLPNIYGCDGIACPPGSYRKGTGRQTNNITVCLPCESPSNTLGSTSCHWVQNFDPTGRTAPLLSVRPSSPPSWLPSDVPSFSVSEYPSLSASEQPSGSPLLWISSEGPTPSFSEQPSSLPNPIPSHWPTTSSFTPSFPSQAYETLSSGPTNEKETRTPTSVPDLNSDGLVFDPPNNSPSSDEGGLIGGTLSAGTFILFAVILAWRRKGRGNQRDSQVFESTQDELILAERRTNEIEYLPQQSLSTIDEEDSEVGILPNARSDSSILKSNSDLPSLSTHSSERRVRFSLPDPWSTNHMDDGHSEVVTETGSHAALSFDTTGAWASWIMNPIIDSSSPSPEEIQNAPESDESSAHSHGSSSPILHRNEIVCSDFYYGLNAPSTEQDYTGVPNDSIYGVHLASDDDSVKAIVLGNLKAPTGVKPASFSEDDEWHVGGGPESMIEI